MRNASRSPGTGSRTSVRPGTPGKPCKTEGCSRHRHGTFGHCAVHLRQRWAERKKKRGDRRKRSGAKPYRGGSWPKANQELRQLEDRCGCCGMSEKVQRKRFGCRLHGDHVIPFRYVRDNRLGPENARANLIRLCNTCHGKKGPLERCLTEKSNILGYVQGMRRMNFPLDTLRAAFSFYGLTIERIV